MASEGGGVEDRENEVLKSWSCFLGCSTRNIECGAVSVDASRDGEREAVRKGTGAVLDVAFSEEGARRGK